MFANRAALLARCNAIRLAQLAVPTDRAMIDESMLRVAIEEGDLTDFSDDDNATLDLALVAIDGALADADALLLSYGIPDTVQTSLLARLAATVALYYLQGAERMTEDLQRAYDDVIKQLSNHSKGLISLVPLPPPTDNVDDTAVIFSNPGRYGADYSSGEGW